MPENSNVSATTDLYFNGIKKGDRAALARAITLIESNAAEHSHSARQLVTRLLPLSGKSIRVGITGVPGAGKSTLIESLGLYLIGQGHRVAVLAIDPSSNRSGGSILGDKTRMETLSRSKDAFIRPSPSRGALGGVARKTRESIVLCEAAAYDVILVETMGVGQGETEVRSMVDFFLLLQIAGAGDELQGIKKGVIEIADAVVVNKADGANRLAAESTSKELKTALHYLTPVQQDWQPPVLTCSATENKGIREIWAMIINYLDKQKKSGRFSEMRKEQELFWLKRTVERKILNLVLNDPLVKRNIKQAEQDISMGKTNATTAAEYIFELIQKNTGL